MGWCWRAQSKQHLPQMFCLNLHVLMFCLNLHILIVKKIAIISLLYDYCSSGSPSVTPANSLLTELQCPIFMIILQFSSLTTLSSDSSLHNSLHKQTPKDFNLIYMHLWYDQHISIGSSQFLKRELHTQRAPIHASHCRNAQLCTLHQNYENKLPTSFSNQQQDQTVQSYPQVHFKHLREQVVLAEDHGTIYQLVTKIIIMQCHECTWHLLTFLSKIWKRAK